MKKKLLTSMVLIGISAALLCACGEAASQENTETAEVSTSEESGSEAAESEAAGSEETESEETESEETESEETESEETESEETVSGEAVSDDAVEEEVDIDYPSNEFESRTGKREFESYDEIISLLQPGEAYAYVNIKGYDSEVLLVANGAYDNLDGNKATIEAVPYTKKASGLYTADSMFASGGTATPLAIDDEGLLYCATHHEVQKLCYGDNGTDIPAIMVMESVYVDSFDDEGMPKTVGGFIRVDNTVVDNDGTDVAADDVAMFEKMYDDYNKAHVVNFTVVE